MKRDEKRFAPVGPISESVDIYEKVLPGKSVWITEWGILDVKDQNDEATLRKATQYVNEVFGVLAYFGNTLACAAWCAWAEGNTLHMCGMMRYQHVFILKFKVRTWGEI